MKKQKYYLTEARWLLAVHALTDFRNKRGKELVDLIIDPSEAPIVRLIFEKTVREGYGSHRLAAMLNEMGIKTHNGSVFQCNTVSRILKNRLFCGYYISCVREN